MNTSITKEHHSKRHALQQDMLHGPLWNKILLFASQVAATAILEQLFNASDIAVVGNFAGTDSTAAVAAVGANSSLISLIVNMFIGIALGANVVIANAIGKEDADEVHKAVHTSIVLALVGGVVIMALGELVAAPLMRLLQVPEEVMPLALVYLRIYLIGMPVILLYNFEAAIYRSVGETRVPLITLAVSGVLNVILNLFFVIVLHMTVNGVATATVISNAVSAIILWRRLRTTNLSVHLEPRELQIDRDCLVRILRIGVPAGVQSGVFSLANVIIQAAINSLGTVIIAGSSAAYNLEVFTSNILTSFGQACTTFVGQNYGAGRLDRCRRSLALSLLEGYIILGAAIAFFLVCGHQVLAIFNRDPEVIEAGYLRLMMVMTCHSFSLGYDVMSGYMRGFGISMQPAAVTTFSICVLRLLWIAFVFPLHPTFMTILTIYPISLATNMMLILAMLLYYRPSRRYAAAHQ